METFPFSNSNCFKSMFEFAIPDERTARNSGGRNYTPTWSPKSLSERPQFTCFGSGLEIALSKSGCFDPHGMSEKWKNKSIGSWSQDLGGCSFVCLPALVSMFLLPFLSDKVLRLVVPLTLQFFGAVPRWEEKDVLNYVLLGWAKWPTVSLRGKARVRSLAWCHCAPVCGLCLPQTDHLCLLTRVLSIIFQSISRTLHFTDQAWMIAF